MFNNFKNILTGVLSTILVIAVGASVYNAFASNSSATAAQPAANVSQGNGNGNGGNNGNGNGGTSTGTSITAIPASDLSAEETASLLYMREEEKLARDVYTTLYNLWGQPTFQNIAASEQTHMDEVKLLLDRYALTDPALAPGQFADANLQVLYNQLVAQGTTSLADALKAGAAIEEIDILDLQTRIPQTDNADIQLVYNNLMNGSYNHLQAFTSVLTQQTGEVYQPQYLSADVYQSIITSSLGNGNQGGNGNGYGGNGGQNGWSGNVTQSQSGSGVPQANISGASTIHGVVNSFDLMGLSLTLDDGTNLYVQLGNARYSQSISFAPATGEGVTVTGFPGDQGMFSAITVTVDSTGQVYTFRSSTGQPLWAGGNGKGNGGNH